MRAIRRGTIFRAVTLLVFYPNNVLNLRLDNLLQNDKGCTRIRFDGEQLSELRIVSMNEIQASKSSKH